MNPSQNLKALIRSGGLDEDDLGPDRNLALTRVSLPAIAIMTVIATLKKTCGPSATPANSRSCGKTGRCTASTTSAY